MGACGIPRRGEPTRPDVTHITPLTMAAIDKADTRTAMKTALELYRLEDFETIWEQSVVRAPMRGGKGGGEGLADVSAWALSLVPWHGCRGTHGRLTTPVRTPA